MSRELMWLTLTVILTGLMWVPYILDRITVRGLMGAMANPSRNDKQQSAWAQRLYFAHTNAVENLVIFATLVLVLDAQGHSTESTAIACAVYFWGAACPCRRLYDGRPRAAHACFRGRLRGAGRAGAGDFGEIIKSPCHSGPKGRARNPEPNR